MQNESPSTFVSCSYWFLKWSLVFLRKILNDLLLSRLRDLNRQALSTQEQNTRLCNSIEKTLALGLTDTYTRLLDYWREFSRRRENQYSIIDDVDRMASTQMCFQTRSDANNVRQVLGDLDRLVGKAKKLTSMSEEELEMNTIMHKILEYDLTRVCVELWNIWVL